MKCGTAAAGEKFSFNEDYGDVFFEGKLTQEQIGYPHIFRVTEAAVHPGTVGYEDDANAGYVVLRVVPDADDASALHAEYAVAKGPRPPTWWGATVPSGRSCSMKRYLRVWATRSCAVPPRTELPRAESCPRSTSPTSTRQWNWTTVPLEDWLSRRHSPIKTPRAGLHATSPSPSTPKATEVSRPNGTTQQLTSAGDAGALLGMTDEEIAQGKTIAIPDAQANADDPATVSLVPSGGLTFEQGHIGKTYTYEVRESYRHRRRRGI